MSRPLSRIEEERLRRRTFAIISHPDAGKTTLTEKLLLFGGSIEIAGAVRGRKAQRAAKSDWMELEKQRGISVSSTVLTFEYLGKQINLLDTPGHHDFSEDTYRTLMATDAAVMVIDVAKGIEAQTEKLFRVCAAKKIPIITFVNKVDRPGASPFEVLAEIEKEFELEAIPQNWPVGDSTGAFGVVDIASGQLHLFTDASGERRGGTIQLDWHSVVENPASLQSAKAQLRGLPVQQVLTDEVIARVDEELELLKLAGHEFEEETFLQGKQTPVYFGSALTNYGVDLFLRGFIELCPPPALSPNEANGATVADEFSGFVFKIQANLDPMHRDRVAFVRVCAGRFERDMDVVVQRSGKKVRLPRALKVFGKERQILEEAFPGDIIGVVCPGELRLGDTIYQGEPVFYPGVPRFSPEVFANVICPDTSRRKQFDRGLQQLIEEGAVQLFFTRGRIKESIIAAVGELQFDVLQFRLESEYNAPSKIQRLSYSHARWYRADNVDHDAIKCPYGSRLVQDSFGSDAILVKSDWDLKMLEKDNPEIKFHSIQESTQPAELRLES